MVESVVGVNRRLAKTYILNLYCECGGTIEAVKPIEIKDKLTAHKCNCCGKRIYVDGFYPCTTSISDEKTENYGGITVFEDEK